MTVMVDLDRMLFCLFFVSMLVSASCLIDSTPASSLRVTELLFSPSALTDAEKARGIASEHDFQFVELQNVNDRAAISLDGVSIHGGIKYNFDSG